ncbi:phosphoribosyltransferase [soil metagenome]
MLYFIDRADAGKQLAERLLKYENQNTVVVALSESSVVVAAQVAMRIHANMVLYMIKDIRLPNEPDAAAAVTSTGGFGYNTLFSAGQIDEIASEYRGYIEEQRIQQNHELNILLGNGGVIKKEMLRHHVVIVVSDGLGSAFSVNLVASFIKSINIKRFVVATPIATVDAIDVMHVVADELHCLSIPDNFMGVDHYYEKQSKVTVDEALKIIRNISLVWKQSEDDKSDVKASKARDYVG